MYKIHKIAFLNEELIKESNYKMFVILCLGAPLIWILVLPASFMLTNSTIVLVELFYEHGLMFLLIYLGFMGLIFIFYFMDIKSKIKKMEKLNWRVEFIVENYKITYILGNNFTKEVSSLKNIVRVFQTKNLIILSRGRYKEAFIIPKGCFNGDELNEFISILKNRRYNRKRKDSKTCNNCGILLTESVRKCPNCKAITDMQLPVPTILFIIILTGLVGIGYLFYDTWKTAVQSRQSFTEYLTRQSTNPAVELEGSLGESIRVKPMIPLSGLSAKEILKIRRDAVSDTIVFGDVSKYEPNDKVFKIEDGFPWIGAYQSSCIGTDGNEKIGDGESRESLAIINPELLYSFSIPYYNNDSSLCSSLDYMIPRKLIYHKDKSVLVAYIELSGLIEKRGHNFLYAIDANARDFGYNFAYADRFYNIQFKQEYNFSKQITRTTGFWHRGYACGLKEGCNNYSPQNDMLYFKTVGTPAAINIKLWKNEPKSPKQVADINYMIVFQ